MLSLAAGGDAEFCFVNYPLFARLMKAAVMYQPGELPRYADFPEPAPQHSDEVVLTMRAAALKHLDKSRASGTHYSTAGEASRATVIGGDGIGVLPNGKRVYAVGDGMLAEKAVADKDRLVPVPAELDDVTAAALPNAVIGSAMGLRFRAQLRKGETVLINGATGFTGKMAVQVAKYLGAGYIIATGRNEQTLRALRALGADELVPLQQDDAALVEQVQAIHARTPIDVIIDYLWGRPAELLLAGLKGKGMFTHKTRFVSIGSVTGDLLQLSAENLRSVDLHLTGSGLGSWTRVEVRELLRDILPRAFKLAAEKKLVVDTLSVKLADIEQLYTLAVPAGKRLVVML